MKLTKQDLIDMGCDPEHVDDWMVIRKDKRAPSLTQTAFKKIVNQATIAGLSIPQVVQVMAENDWRGFMASWLSNQQAAMQKENKQQVRSALRNIHSTDW